jgi:hypothetical protein
VTPISSLHQLDFYGWVTEQCAALQAHDSSRLDWDGLKEELEALGRQEYRELVSRMGVLLGHLPQTSRWSLTQVLDVAALCDTRGDWGDLGL